MKKDEFPTVDKLVKNSINDVLDNPREVSAEEQKCNHLVLPDNWYVYSDLHDMVSMLPSAQLKQKTGYWFDVGSLSCRCSECGCKNNKESNYCPECGAYMKGESNDQTTSN